MTYYHGQYIHIPALKGSSRLRIITLQRSQSKTDTYAGSLAGVLSLPSGIAYRAPLGRVFKILPERTLALLLYVHARAYR